ncbi:MAG: hypothetical protein Q4F31_09910 [Eubacteriales bacterium]|nr:hypothetical protein [Eubacteriales bacterium]
MNNIVKKTEKNETGKQTKKEFLLRALLLLAIIIAVAFWGNRSFLHSVSEINNEHIEELAAHDIKIINSSIANRLNTLEIIAEDIAYWSKKDGTSIISLLHSDASFLSDADKISLVSSDGTICSSNNVTESRPDIAELCLSHGNRSVHRFDNIVDVFPDLRREYIFYDVKLIR